MNTANEINPGLKPGAQEDLDGVCTPPPCPHGLLPALQSEGSSCSMIDDTFELYDLRIEVHQDEKRPMICNHPKGSYFLLSGENLKIPDGMSFPIYPLAALMPILPAKQRVTHTNDWMSTDTDIACPDPYCGGIFRIQRIGKSIFHHHAVTATSLKKAGPT